MSVLAYSLFGVAGVAALVVVMLSGAFPTASGSTSQTCDLQGTVSGTVNDVVLVPIFTNWNVDLSTVNCRETGIGDSLGQWWRGVFPGSINAEYPQAALLQVGGPYHIQVKIFDNHNKLLGVSECYSFTTNVGTVSQQFSYPVAFDNLPKGENLIVNAYSECKPEAGIQATFSETV